MTDTTSPTPAEHTALPWVYKHGRIYANAGRRERADAIADICIAFKASKERDANAALIVTAVNERAGLLERVRRYEEITALASDAESADIMAFVSGEDQSEVAKLKASLAYTAGALGRELAVGVAEDELLRERVRKLKGLLRKARVAIATWSPDPTEPLEEIDAALQPEQETA